MEMSLHLRVWETSLDLSGILLHKPFSFICLLRLRSYSTWRDGGPGLHPLIALRYTPSNACLCVGFVNQWCSYASLAVNRLSSLRTRSLRTKSFARFPTHFHVSSASNSCRSHCVANISEYLPVFGSLNGEPPVSSTAVRQPSDHKSTDLVYPILDVPWFISLIQSLSKPVPPSAANEDTYGAVYSKVPIIDAIRDFCGLISREQPKSVKITRHPADKDVIRTLSGFKSR